MSKIDIAFIGGSGLYKIPGLKNIKWVKVKSNFGNASDAFCIGTLNKRNVVFLPRHGRNHNISPSNINYRANIECLKKLGVQNIISLSAVGSLRSDYVPGDFVIVNQYIDKTYLRKKTFFDEDIIAHVPLSNPVCDNLSKLSKKVLTKLKINHHSTGTYICMEGPQFSTLAESELYRSWGCDVIGMTNMPEAKLAREAGICYASLSMITDFDCWHPNHDNVSIEQIINTLKENSEKAFKFIEEFSLLKEIYCNNALKKTIKNSIITDIKKAKKSTLEKLKNIL